LSSVEPVAAEWNQSAALTMQSDVDIEH